MNNKKDLSHNGQKSDRNNNQTGKNQYAASGSRSDKDVKSESSHSGSPSKGRSSR
jgi:hypothetical protein